MSEGFVISGRENVEAARWITVRSALGFEVKTGMKMSNRYSPMKLAKAICGSKKGTKAAVYADLNAFMVECGFEDKAL